jgi:small subunit ribosomal protein S24e
MNVHMISNVENKLLDRKEIQAEVSFDGATPKRAQLKEAVSHKVGANPELVVLRKVSSSFGRKVVTVMIHAYSTKESLMSTEPVFVKVREGMMPKPEKKKKAAAAPAKKKKE